MDGRAFLVVARELAAGSTAAHWRSAAGRAYYALFLEARDHLERGGFVPQKRDPVHSFVRLRFIYAADADLVKVGRTLDNLLQLRTTADYHLRTASFVDDTEAQTCLRDATAALALLDAVEADPARRAAAISAMRIRWP
jgi:uncharacterized protein (UPF0332 family)